jgi:hypothetical protein
MAKRFGQAFPQEQPAHQTLTELQKDGDRVHMVQINSVFTKVSYIYLSMETLRKMA